MYFGKQQRCQNIIQLESYRYQCTSFKSVIDVCILLLNIERYLNEMSLYFYALSENSFLYLSFFLFVLLFKKKHIQNRYNNEQGEGRSTKSH